MTSEEMIAYDAWQAWTKTAWLVRSMELHGETIAKTARQLSNCDVGQEEIHGRFGPRTPRPELKEKLAAIEANARKIIEDATALRLKFYPEDRRHD